ncbi:hypothetical protein HanPI659440_Chr05g0189661 [Helianthus annuus]|nr:hypothetical protein HanPI659440_Chr05g0189661 [Helianthus annuus]
MMMTIYAESMVKRTDILGFIFKYPITFSLLLMLTVLCKEYSLCEKCFSSCSSLQVKYNSSKDTKEDREHVNQLQIVHNEDLSNETKKMSTLKILNCF